MQSLNIKADKKSPSVVFEPYSGLMVIKGKSSLENPERFYEALIKWTEKYAADPAIETTFRMEMEYFNSSSAKSMMKMFRILENIAKSPKKRVSIQWCHDGQDYSMKESGEDFQSMLEIPFEFVQR